MTAKKFEVMCVLGIGKEGQLLSKSFPLFNSIPQI